MIFVVLIRVLSKHESRIRFDNDRNHGRFVGRDDFDRQLEDGRQSSSIFVVDVARHQVAAVVGRFDESVDCSFDFSKITLRQVKLIGHGPEDGVRTLCDVLPKTDLNKNIK